MELKRAEGRRGLRFFIKIVEERFPDDERVMRVSRISVAVGSAVAEGLAGQLDDLPFSIAPYKRKIVRERIAVPAVSLLNEQLQAVGALGAGTPPCRSLSGSAQDHVRRAPDHVLLFLARQIAGDFMMVAVAGDLVAMLDDCPRGIRISLGDPAAGHKRRFDLRLVQDSENPPDSGFRTILCLRVFLVIDFAVG